MKLTDMLAVATAAQKPRPDQGGTLSTLIDKIKSDVERFPNRAPELTDAQRATQARANGLFIADNILTGEAAPELADMWAAFRADFGPTGAIEEEMIRHLTASGWLMRRIDRIFNQRWRTAMAESAVESGNAREALGSHQGVTLLLNSAFQRTEHDVFTRLDYFRKIGERRWSDALKQLTQYRKATGRKPAILPTEMPFEPKAERNPVARVTPVFPDPEPDQSLLQQPGAGD